MKNNKRTILNKLSIFPVLLAGILFVSAQKLPKSVPQNLTVNLRETPMGIDSKPHFSWNSQVEKQTAYQICVAVSLSDLQSGNYVWNSGKIKSSTDLQVAYEGTALKSATRYYWQLKVWDKKNKMSVSAPSWWETGLLDNTAWQPAKWIGGRQPQDHYWTDMTATVNFRVTNAEDGINFLFHALPVGKTWGEAYSWKLSSEAGTAKLFQSAKKGDKVVYVNNTDNFSNGDDIYIGTSSKTVKIESVGNPSTETTLETDAKTGSTTLKVFPAGNLDDGDEIYIGTGDNREKVIVKSVSKRRNSDLPHGLLWGEDKKLKDGNLKIETPLMKSHDKGDVVVCKGSGITLATPLTASYDEGADVQEVGKVQLTLTTLHYAGNTGIPGATGKDKIVPGVNYFDPQGVTNPMETGTRSVDIATILLDNSNGINCRNFTTADHELKVKVDGATVTTWIDGIQVDSRTLSGDQLRNDGSIGFESGSNAIVRNVKVEIPGKPADNFYTDFSGGFNPFEDGIINWTNTKDSVANGLVLTEGKGIMLPIANPAPLLRKTFDVSASPVTSARLYISGGSYPKVAVNGISVTTDGQMPDKDGHNIPHLTPDDGQSESFILYNTFDVTNFIKAGKANVLAAELGRGWTGLTIPTEWYWNSIPAHADPRTIAKLIVTHKDGSQEVIVSDGSWKTTDGPTVFETVHTGDKYNAQLAEKLGNWQSAGYDDSKWTSATVMNPMGSCYGSGKYHDLIPATGELPDGFKASELKAMENEPIAVRENMKPVEIMETYPGSKVYLFKFDQMHTGWLKLHLKNITSEKAGLTLRMRADNIIEGEGTKVNPYVLSDSKQHICGSIQTDYYTLSDKSEQVWSPSFHYSGEGGIEVYGLYNVLGRAPQLPQDTDLITAEVASSGFHINLVTTSNSLLNRIQSLCQWTMLNDAHGHPTDTPSREKNGWTGDGWADEEAWMNNFDVSQFYRLWVYDMAEGMNPEGDLNVVMPAPRAYGYDNTPGWNAANGAVPAWDMAFFEIPMDLNRYYGDKATMADIYPKQEKFMDYYSKYFTKANDYTYSNILLGEYAAGTLPVGSTENINHQLYYRMATYMANVSNMLGYPDKAKKYKALADDVLKTFIKLYWDEGKHSFQKGNSGNLETEQILAVAYDMAPGNDLPTDNPRYLKETSQTHQQNLDSCMAVVANSISSHGDRIGTGIYGLHYLFNLLDEYGYKNLAYSVATGLEKPSWGDILMQGGTTLQELWGDFEGDHHYHSSIVTWYYQGLAGIQPMVPGYASIRIKPYVPTNAGNDDLKGNKVPLTSVSASIKTARGLAKSSWINSENFTLSVTIPSNTEAEIWVPSASGQLKNAPKGARFVKTDDSYAIYKVGVGDWTFTADKINQE